MLEAIGAGSSRRIGKQDWADIWLESPELEKVKQTIIQLDAEALQLEVGDSNLSNECESRLRRGSI